MDSLTQFALGAAVGGAVAGHRWPRRALFWGAVCGTIPDLDVFVPLGDPVRDFTYHRSASHSLFVLAALTPLIVWLVTRVHRDTRHHRWRWAALVYACFSTHVLLDSFTVYGTQIFWPVYTTPMTWSTIFIIDPLYTVWLLLGAGTMCIAGARRASSGWRWNLVGLALSSVYLVWSVGAKLHVESVARDALTAQGFEPTSVLTTPAPFNTLLWRVVGVDAERYHEGFYSLLDPTRDVTFRSYPRSPELLVGLEDEWSVRRLAWFTKGFYATGQEGGRVILADLRMGLTPDYVFRFVVGERDGDRSRPLPPERVVEPRNMARLSWVWERIWDSEAVEAERR